MTNPRKLILGTAVALGFGLGAAAPGQAADPIVIGGGSTTGVYYQVALHVCNLVNKYDGKKYNCVGRPALGSVFNINAVNRGLLDFGVAQSDRNSQAWNGEGSWKGKPVKNLRSVFSAHPETVLLVARADSGIKSVADLKGKRVNIGNPGSGQRGNAEDVIRLYNLKGAFTAQGLQQGQASRALIDKKIAAFFYTVGNPSAAIEEPANSTAISIISVNSPAIKKFVASKPYYVMTTIPANTYKGVSKPVETYAVKATVVTSSTVSADKVYDVVKAVFEHLDELKKAHKAFAILEPKAMLEGLTAPLHDGAKKYYKEKGWIK
ncbi:MAG: TAXI family TRAP transporter solute-binding subunit [Bauldia litoralis]